MRRSSREMVEAAPEPAADLPHTAALDAKERDLLSLSQGQVAPRQRLGRGSEHRWRHATRPPEQPCPDSLRQTGRQCSLLARPALGNRHPKLPQLLTRRRGRPTRRGQGARPDASNAASEPPVQPPPSGCCDDHLNPPDTCPSSTPSAWPKPASNPRSAASATVTTVRL